MILAVNALRLRSPTESVSSVSTVFQVDRFSFPRERTSRPLLPFFFSPEKFLDICREKKKNVAATRFCATLRSVRGVCFTAEELRRERLFFFLFFFFLSFSLSRDTSYRLPFQRISRQAYASKERVWRSYKRVSFLADSRHVPRASVCRSFSQQDGYASTMKSPGSLNFATHQRRGFLDVPTRRCSTGSPLSAQ